MVPVLDKNIEEQDRPGNKFRRLCVACERFGRMASGEEWADHDGALVIPAGEPRDADAAIQASVFNSQGHADVAAPSGEGRQESTETATDGGNDGADDADPDQQIETSDGPDPDNEFDCPACGTYCTGYPDVCSNCGAPFEW